MRVPFIAFLSALLILVTDFAFVQAGVVPLTTDQRWGLNIQNMGRSSKKLKPLVWDPKLAQDAAAYAKVLARTQKLQHSGVGGENLFYESRGSAPFSDAAKAWMAEKPLYHNEIIPQGNFAAYGHYSKPAFPCSASISPRQRASCDTPTNPHFYYSSMHVEVDDQGRHGCLQG